MPENLYWLFFILTGLIRCENVSEPIFHLPFSLIYTSVTIKGFVTSFPPTTATRSISFNKLIDVAKERIFDKSKSISQVAYDLGFKYPQHFTRLFKQRVGQTPNEYRNSLSAPLHFFNL
jgi:hypothetical protein